MPAHEIVNISRTERFVSLNSILLTQRELAPLVSYGAAASVLMMIVAMGFVVLWYRVFRDALTAQ